MRALRNRTPRASYHSTLCSICICRTQDGPTFLSNHRRSSSLLSPCSLTTHVASFSETSSLAILYSGRSVMPAAVPVRIHPGSVMICETSSIEGRTGGAPLVSIAVSRSCCMRRSHAINTVPFESCRSTTLDARLMARPDGPVVLSRPTQVVYSSKTRSKLKQSTPGNAWDNQQEQPTKHPSIHRLSELDPDMT